MDRVYLQKLNKRISLVNPDDHPVHAVMATIDEAYYYLIKKDNGAYLIGATTLQTHKIDDTLHLINEKTGNTLGVGTVIMAMNARDLRHNCQSIKDLIKYSDVYLYLLSDSNI